MRPSGIKRPACMTTLCSRPSAAFRLGLEICDVGYELAVSCTARTGLSSGRTATRADETALRLPQAFFRACGITVERVLTGNGTCCPSKERRAALAAAGIIHERNPALPAADERRSGTLQPHPAGRVAYAHPYRSETARRQAYPGWLHTCNQHRGYTAFNGEPPARRAAGLTGQYTWVGRAHWAEAAPGPAPTGFSTQPGTSAFDSPTAGSVVARRAPHVAVRASTTPSRGPSQRHCGPGTSPARAVA
jgi:hypothetical protein